MPIKSIVARQIFDSRGFPTVEVDVNTDLGIFRASVPSNSSNGMSRYEAMELRDGDPNYLGRGVLKAVNNVNKTIGPALIKTNLEANKQKEIDDFMIKLDGTDNKSLLGSNAILAVSIAVCKAGAAMNKMPLYKYIAYLANNKKIVMPLPIFNVIHGGKDAANRLAFQEYMIVPMGAISFSEAMQMGIETYHHLREIIEERFGTQATTVCDEGSFIPDLETNNEVYELLQEGIAKAGYKGKIGIAVDVGASNFFKGDQYDLDFKNINSSRDQWMTPDDLMQMYRNNLKDYPIVSIEDPFFEEDFDSWCRMEAGFSVQLVGGALLSANRDRIEEAAKKQSCNCLLLKCNQIGTVSETIETFLFAKSLNWTTIVAHCPGDTEDSFIADLSVGLSAGQIKAGAPCRSERLCKYNQLLRIESQLGEAATLSQNVYKRGSM